MAKSKFNVGQFITENPLISLIVVGGAVYGVTRIVKGVKKGKDKVIETSEKNPFNYTVFMTAVEDKANKKRQQIARYTDEEATSFAEKLHQTWNTWGFDYPEEAQTIIRNMPSKYDFAFVLKKYMDKYGFDYQAKIKDKYNEDNYSATMTVATDLPTEYRIKK